MTASSDKKLEQPDPSLPSVGKYSNQPQLITTLMWASWPTWCLDLFLQVRLGEKEKQGEAKKKAGAARGQGGQVRRQNKLGYGDPRLAPS